MDAGSAYTCQSEQLKNDTFCDYTAPVHERVKDLVSRLVLPTLRLIPSAFRFSTKTSLLYSLPNNCIHKWEIVHPA